MPGHSSYRVVVVGAGFGGIGMATALKRAGVEDFVLVDRGDDLGGTWRDNTYPGAACGVPANLYSFSSSPRRWSRRFPGQEETLAYLRALAEEQRLGPHFRFGSGVAAAEFDERRAIWNLTAMMAARRPAGGRRGHRGERHPVRAPDRPGRRPRRCLPAQRSLRAAQG